MELLMIFIGGLLGSAHCVGMCGAFAISIGANTPSWRVNLLRQLTYSLGRVFTYSAAGAMAGYGGWRLTRSATPFIHAQAWLAVLAGMLLAIQGLAAAGVWRRIAPGGKRPACLSAGLFASFLKAPRLGDVFLAGVLNGLLPCGLVYAYLALATSSGNMLSGFIQMSLFGLGTLPIMVLTGCGGNLLGLVGRRRLLHVAAWCVVLTGALSIARGAAFLQNDAQVAAASCPACAEAAPNAP
ncbi:MAG TPA: sulfite exporter TauE/SafE family protein [Pirellulales bacterium]|nr:sulfite exporter TauE/SafE family protein [Pirellulales bacterium]